jgi:hypothetical protein
MGQRRRDKQVRLRTKRLDQLDDTKLALALWLLAREVVVDETQRPQPGPKDGPADLDLDEAVATASNALRLARAEEEPA